ncbi:MAG: glucosaminidase domain-containing protein [Anaerovoracaceae bacterium]|jgi:hypothetical protein
MKKIAALAIAVSLMIPGFAMADTGTQTAITIKAAGNSYNSIKVSWSKVAGARYYKVYRATSKTGTFRRISVVKPSVFSYTDRKLSFGKRYYYKIKTAVSGSTTSSLSSTRYSAVASAKPVVAAPRSFKAVKSGYYNKAKITWLKSAGATGYRIYRATSPTGKFTRVVTLTPDKLQYTNKNLTSSGVYYYKMRALRMKNGRNYLGRMTSVRKVTVKYEICGSSTVTADQLAAFYKSSGHTYPAFYKNTDAKTLTAFCQMYIDEAGAEGIRPEVPFVQAMLETGWLSFGGDVKISQNNFAGLGAVGGGASGNSFKTVRYGIRAQVQHLKAYASTAPLVKKCVDKRFGYVDRGCAPYVEWLGIPDNPTHQGWAATDNYGYMIVKMIYKIQ